MVWLRFVVVVPCPFLDVVDFMCSFWIFGYLDVDERKNDFIAKISHPVLIPSMSLNLNKKDDNYLRKSGNVLIGLIIKPKRPSKTSVRVFSILNLSLDNCNRAVVNVKCDSSRSKQSKNIIIGDCE